MNLQLHYVSFREGSNNSFSDSKEKTVMSERVLQDRLTATVDTVILGCYQNNRPEI